MQMMEDVKIEKKNIILPVFFCLFFLLCYFSFMIYLIHKNENMENLYFGGMAKKNQEVLKQNVERDFRNLESLAFFLKLADISDSQQVSDLVDKINEENLFVKIGFSDQVKQEMDKEGRYEVVVKDKKNQVLGTLYAVNSEEMFHRILDNSSMSEEEDWAIFDRKGNVIGSSVDDLSLFTDKIKMPEDIWKTIKNNQTASFNAHIPGGTRMRAVMLPVGINDWYMLNVFFNTSHKILVQELGLGIVILISFGVFLIAILSRCKLIGRNQEKLFRLAYKDHLTGIGNFYSFKQEMKQIIQNKKITGYAIWFLDVKKFKFVNDILGYDEGDRLLVSIAGKLQEKKEPEEVFCRIFADSFVGIHQYGSKKEMKEWFNSIVEEYKNWIMPQDKKIPIELCMGVYCLEEADKNLSADLLVNRANIAQKHIKDQPGNQFGFYDKEISDKVVSESELESEIDNALENHEFKLFIQPKISIQRGNQIVGGEVLVRWEHPHKGTISPGKFIPLMERDGKIILLDRYMFEAACKWLHDYLQEGRPPINLAVNVSKIGMLKDDFVEFYTSVKNKYEIADGLLELEFTETVLLKDDNVFNYLVGELRKSGFVCSLDDFGSGYSSLNLLKNLPIDVLKLDIMFFRKSADITRERIVISNIINMAKELQIRTIAEGVEYVETVDFLQLAGCDVIQGYVFFKPMPVEAFDAMLMENNGIAMEPIDVAGSETA